MFHRVFYTERHMSADAVSRKARKQRQRAAILSCLTVAMGLLFLRAYLQMAAKPATAAPLTDSAADGASTPETGSESADARLALSRELWKRLRKVGGAAPAAVFTFDRAYYPLDPNRPRPVPVESPQATAVQTPQLPVYDEAAARRAHMAAVHDQARNLVVRSTFVNTGAHPVAVVNDRILSVGDRIDGFEITAIRAREVEFRKEDVTLTSKMVDMPRGQ